MMQPMGRVVRSLLVRTPLFRESRAPLIIFSRGRWFVCALISPARQDAWAARVFYTQVNAHYHARASSCLDGD